MRRWVDRVFEAVERPLEAAETRRWFSTGLLLVFVAVLVLVEVNRRVGLPPWLAARVTTNHFVAVDVAFSIILFFEVIEMALGIGRSFSLGVGRQFAIFALILLRSSVKELGHLPEPLEWEPARDSLVQVLGDAFGGLAVFGVMGLYFRLLERRPRVSDLEQEQGFIVMKKGLSLLLLVVFAVVAAQDLVRLFVEGAPSSFFETLYTVLVFGDVVLVLVSLRYTTSYAVVFRNSAFAVASVILRFALTAPAPWNAALGVVGALYAVGVVWTYQRVDVTYDALRRASGPGAGSEGSDTS